jgi:Protein of unknown function (DUF3667)
MSSPVICKNCGHHFSGKFCNACGEKIYTDKDKKLSHLFEEGFHFVTHFEGSFLTTLKTVFTRPGKFSLDYCNGIRKKYFKPVSLFMLLVVLYLVFPFFKGLNMKLNSITDSAYGYTWAAAPLVQSKMKANSIDYAALCTRYDNKSPAVSKLALFILLPLGALFLWLIFVNSKKFYFDHFILSIELSSIFIGLHFLFIPLLAFIAVLINKNWERFFWDDNYWLAFSIASIDLLIVYAAFKRFYTQKWYWIIPKAVLYFFLFGQGVLYLYQLLVLVVTLKLC